MEMAEFVELVTTPPVDRRLVLHHNLHSVYLFHTDAVFRELYERADHVNIDGFPVLVAARWATRGTGLTVKRLENIDFLPHLRQCEVRVALVGGSPAGNARAVVDLTSEGCSVRGWDGYEGVDRLAAGGLDELRAFAPDIVVVGLGMPLQERWILDSWPDLPRRTTVVTVGAAIDQIGGEASHAPHLIRRIGFAWLWRLAREPRRLGRRYLVEPVQLARVLRAQRRQSPDSSVR